MKQERTKKGLGHRFGRGNTATAALSVRLALWCAVHWRMMPVFMTGYLGEYLSVQSLLSAEPDRASHRCPGRVGLRRIRCNAWNPDTGMHRFGTMPLTVGRRFGAVQAIQDGDPLFTPLRLYFGLRRLEVLFAPLGKVEALIHHIQLDQMARNERDQRTVVPMTDLQMQAGLGNMSHGLFGIIDFVACRNHLTYEQVYELSDTQLYGILMIEHDRAIAQRQLERTARQKQERQMAAARARR